MNQLAAVLGHIAWPISEQLQQNWKKVILLTLSRKEEPVRRSGSVALAAFDIGYGLAPSELEQYPFLYCIVIDTLVIPLD